MKHLLILVGWVLLVSCSSPKQTHYDVVIKNGIIYDGTGGTPYPGDIAIDGKKITYVGQLSDYESDTVIDAQGLAISPGFINMLSWAASPLLEDGRSMSNIKQGVTLEVFGEGHSLGPLNEEMRSRTGHGALTIIPNAWSTFAEGMQYLVDQGITPNIASFVGAATVRIHELGNENRAPTSEEIKRMQELVRGAMEEGALGVGSSLIYPPGSYASTDELIALSKVAAEYDGKYISHLRSEGYSFIEAVEELLTIAHEAGIAAEIFHLKAAGQNNWSKLDTVLYKIDSANEAGLDIAANMYTYPAASTWLGAAMPPWVNNENLHDPEFRPKILAAMREPSKEWDNYFFAAGDPDNILLVQFGQDSLKYLTGKTVGEIAAMRGTSPEETILDLAIQSGRGIKTVYFLMSEENVKRQIQLPYMSFGSDGLSIAAEGERIKNSIHPRTYGTFARLLGKYVREEQILSLPEAIHRLTLLSAEKYKIRERGKLASGYYADIVVFDPDKIQDKATFEQPHQYAEGVVHVFVNGTQVLNGGSHTGAMPGMFVRGPGYQAADEVSE
uniref:D-aminoacylase n=1 Tax=Roseihalotalea indica TaxID=2867963 RepID=A0AA49GJ44_9BACT|nr:D-aminoacylase [Tunicatimonas sp. TK19036]